MAMRLGFITVSAFISGGEVLLIWLNKVVEYYLVACMDWLLTKVHLLLFLASVIYDGLSEFVLHKFGYRLGKAKECILPYIMITLRLCNWTSAIFFEEEEETFF